MRDKEKRDARGKIEWGEGTQNEGKGQNRMTKSGSKGKIYSYERIQKK